MGVFADIKYIVEMKEKEREKKDLQDWLHSSADWLNPPADPASLVSGLALSLSGMALSVGTF